jgi:hypothetical protein
MSTFLPEIAEFTTRQLEAELAERKKRHTAGVCSHCLRDHGRFPICKYPARHSGREA